MAAAFTATLLAASLLGPGSASAFVFGEAPEDSGPHVAIVGPSALCSGTLIDQHWVLSAAHCFGWAAEPPDLDQVRVISGTVDLAASPGRATRIQRLVLAPENELITRTRTPDAVLVRLAEPVPLGSYPALKAPSEDEAIPAVRSFGFGVNEDGTTGKLSFGDRFPEFFGHGTLITRSESNALCGGDSGGATMFGELIVAVNTDIFSPDGLTAPQCRPPERAGHVWVPYLLPWIAETVEVVGPTTSCPGLDRALSQLPESGRAGVRIADLAETCRGSSAAEKVPRARSATEAAESFPTGTRRP